MRLIIIGGVAARMNAASQARRISRDAEIIVLERGQEVSHGVCGLPYKFPPDQSMDDPRVISAQRFRDERGIDVRLGHVVERIDRGARRLLGCRMVGPETAALG